MSDLKVQYLVDLPSRELNVITYIKKVIEEVSNNKIMVDHQDFYNRLTHYDFFARTEGVRDAIITPSYNVKRTPSIVARFDRQQSKKIIVDHAEQLFPEHLYEEKLNTEYKKTYNRHVSSHLTWGKNFAKKLSKHSGVDKRKIYITGNAKLDIAKRLQIEQKKPQSRQPCVLVVSNFLAGDYNDKEWKKFKDKYSVNVSKPLHKYAQQERISCIKWVKKASERFNNVSFMVRPHPGEETHPYEELREKNNVIITGSKPFAGDLLKANVVFQFTSTSIFEALINKIPVYSMRLKSERNIDEHYLNDIFKWVDENEFLHIVEKVSQGVTLTPTEDRLDAVQEYMYKPFGNSLLRKAIAVKEILGNEYETEISLYDKLFSWQFRAMSSVKSIATKLSLILHKIGIDTGIYEYSKRSWHNRIDKNEYVSRRNIEKSSGLVKPLIDEREIRVLRNNNYKIRDMDFGRVIDIPKDVERQYRY